MSDQTPHKRDNVTMHPAGRQGRLTTSGGKELPVRAFERGTDVALVVLVDTDGPLETDLLDPALLEYTTVRGVVRLRGEAVFENHDLIRFKAQDQAVVVQRREFVRIHSPQPVTLLAEPEKAEPEQSERAAHAVNLSGGGMLMSGAEALAVGDLMRFAMQIRPEQPPIRGVARVVRVHDDGKRALAFDRIGEADRQRLIGFVFECMRIVQAKTRGDRL
jgi:hypothetical protein